MNDKRKSIVTRARRMGHVEMPAADIDFDATYTIEFESDGQLHRWTSAKPVRQGDTAVFEYGNGKNGVIVEMSATLTKIFDRP